MDLLRPIPPGYRAATLAVAASALLHGAVLVGYRVPDEGGEGLDAPVYTATLAPAAVAEAPPAPPPAPKPAPRPKRSEPRPGETVAVLPAALETPPDLALPEEESAPAPDVVALAQPAVVLAPPALPAFRPEDFPEELTIAYSLTSAFADGQAEYTWKRDGDRYEITGNARATGFFTLFLEGQIDQSASGRVTPEGLQPEQFTERRGTTPEEGLAFDWAARSVEFRRGDNRRSAPLAKSTVDWLSMIFQLAHQPPKGDSMDLRVYTQRRLYEFRLAVVGVEDLELPFGTTRTLHLHHAGEKPEEAVDVWLGVDQHYLPVKLRYPVARNRLMVEQTATSVRAR